jgi:DNA-binding beta-propeller fold protein YncE
MIPMRIPSRPARIAGLTLLLAVTLGACAATGPSLPGPSDPPGSGGAASPAPTSADPAALPESSDAWLVVGRRGEPELEVILAGTLEQIYRLPSGVPGELWGRVTAVVGSGATTLVKEITVQPDLPAATRTIDGAWRLPTIGVDALPVGVSADGSTVVLVEAGAPAAAGTSRFAIVVRGQANRVIELAGSFEFDAISPDGAILYVVEHLPGPPEARYQVRAVDVATGLLREAVIVDKRNLDEVMGGWPITQLGHASGVVFTLYRGADHPFIHALNTREAWAVCIDLPRIGADDAAAALDWGLAQTADGGTVFAANATLGLATAIDPYELTITGEAAFEAPRAAATISLAKFGHQEGGPVGRRAVVSTDGATLFAAGSGGIVRIDTDRLAVAAEFLPGQAVDALALTPDGSTLYVLLHADGRIVKIDAVTGQEVGQVAGDGFDRLVAIVPW